MKLFLILMLVALVILSTRGESFVEMFGFSGHTKPIDYIRMNDPRPNLSGYTKTEAKIDNDMMEVFALQANEEISKRTGICTYIIETAKVVKYTGSDNDLYECVFMAMKKGGFSYGFSVVATFEVKGKSTKLVSLRSQPLDVKESGDVMAFAGSSAGATFVDYALVKEGAFPKKSELVSVKNKLQ